MVTSIKEGYLLAPLIKLVLLYQLAYKLIMSYFTAEFANTSSNMEDLFQDQINSIIDEIIELKRAYKTGEILFWDGEPLTAPMTLREFSDKFEILNNKLAEVKMIKFQW